jgi:pimeloyl-ACP methyl ester carboxylesterase
MGRGWKILIGVLVALAVLVGINTLVTDAETKSAEVTEPGGRIVALPGGDLQVLDTGPRTGSPIVLIHCFTCAMDWWNGVRPRLTAHDHRVISVDLLGHGGSEKPSSGYVIQNQADLVAEALNRIGVRDAVVAGHSLGGGVAVALAEQSPELVDRVVIIDTAPETEGSLGLLAKLALTPVIGEAIWRVKPDFSVRDALGVAFAPGFDVPDEFVEDANRMTYSSYDGSHGGLDKFKDEEALDRRMRDTEKPLLVLMGAEEQIIDEPSARLAEYRATVPGARTKLIAGAGHSPNVEKPAETAALVLSFAKAATSRKQRAARHEMQEPLQKRNAVRKRP